MQICHSNLSVNSAVAINGTQIDAIAAALQIVLKRRKWLSIRWRGRNWSRQPPNPEFCMSNESLRQKMADF